MTPETVTETLDFLSSASTESLPEQRAADISPASSDRVYSLKELAAAWLYSADGEKKLELRQGLNAIGGVEATELQDLWSQQGNGLHYTAESMHMVSLDTAAQAVVEITSNLHVLYDLSGSVEIGHQKGTIRKGTGYVVDDGKQIWLDGYLFWYRKAELYSPSPPPPWRRQQFSNGRAQASKLQREIPIKLNSPSPVHETNEHFDVLSPLLGNSPQLSLSDDLLSSPRPLIQEGSQKQSPPHNGVSEPEELEPTQPLSPDQYPRADAAAVSSNEHLPPASAFVYAPERVVLHGPAGRYPYDFEQMEATLHNIVQPTPPTQPELYSSDADNTYASIEETPPIAATAAAASVANTNDTGISSDFSQTFLSPALPEDQPQDIAQPVNPHRTPINPPPKLPLQQTPGAAIRPLHFRHSTPLTLSTNTRASSRSSDDIHGKSKPTQAADEFPDDLLATGHRRRRSTHTAPRPPSPALLHSSSAENTPTRINGSQANATLMSQIPMGKSDEELDSSPALLPQPDLLLSEKPTKVEDLFDPNIDPPSSLNSPESTEPSPTLPQQPPAPPPLAAPPKKAASADGPGWINADERPKRTPPIGGSRSKSLRESLRKLPGGNRGPARTGLSKQRRQLVKPAASTPARSHRNLGLGSTPPLTRQRSNSTVAEPTPSRITLSGLPAAERSRVMRALEQHAVLPTENPLEADVCIRHGPLGRTLKVLCALARGTPIVSVAWIHMLEPKKSLLASNAHAHLLIDRVTERDWGFSLGLTLERARKQPLLSDFCVLIASVSRDPICLSIIARAAGAKVLNDFAGREEQMLKGGNQSRFLSGQCQQQNLMAALDAAGGSQSSEHDNDSDEDWCLESTKSTKSHRRRKKKRKTLPRLKPVPIPDYDDNALCSEPSLILAPPTPNAASSKPLAKRSRNGSTLGSDMLHLTDFTQDIQSIVDARRKELGCTDSQLLVITDNSAPQCIPENARITTPELLIQSIIHSGPAGLAAARVFAEESKAHPFDITVLERNSISGGVWNHTPTASCRYNVPQPDAAAISSASDARCPESNLFPTPMYDELHTNLPTDVMQFPDFPFASDIQTFPSHQEVNQYLQLYADAKVKHHQNVHILYEHHVSHIDFDSQTKQWTCQAHNLATNQPVTLQFDVILVCTGRVDCPFIPQVPGLSELHYKGPTKVIHAKEFRRASEYTGQTVLVVGGASSATDISRQLTYAARQVHISTADDPQNPIQRDPRIIPIIGAGCNPEVPLTKHPRVKRISDVVEFADGATIPLPDTIIYATGYLCVYPFIDTIKGLTESNDSHGYTLSTGQGVEDLYKFLLYSRNPLLAILGVPNMVVPFPLYEYQAMYLAHLYQGHITLPSTSQMLQESQAALDQPNPFIMKYKQASYMDDLVDCVGANQSRLGHTSAEWLERWKNTVQLRKQHLGY
ncbi:monooxygenase [Coemansia sp. RSA 1250]|nr:monooxygenase [Coemansia sp. RSA 1250]